MKNVASIRTRSGMNTLLGNAKKMTPRARVGYRFGADVSAPAWLTTLPTGTIVTVSGDVATITGAAAADPASGAWAYPVTFASGGSGTVSVTEITGVVSSPSASVPRGPLVTVPSSNNSPLTNPAAPSTMMNIWGAVTVASMAASAYHGYKRNGKSVGWGIGWGLLGSLFPIITPVVAVAEGFGKKKGR